MQNLSNRSKQFWLEKNSWYALFVLLIFTIFSYISLASAGFVDYDDPGNVVQNRYITGLTYQNIKALFSSAIYYSYNPVTFLSYSIEYSIFGMNAGIFHSTNILLHLINICLVYILIRNLSGNIILSLFSAALFALHPMQSDVVSWISARNYLLCTLFYLLTLISYHNYLKSQTRKLQHLLFSIFFFLIACLSKAQAVTLPLLILCFDFIYGIKYKTRDIFIRIIFVIIAIGTGLLTIFFRADMGKTELISDFTSMDNFFLFCYSFIRYIYKIFLPEGLTAIDPFPLKTIKGNMPAIVYISPLLIIILVTVFILLRKRISKLMVFGLVLFSTNIFISQITFLEDGFSANRYAYLSSIGLFLIIPSASNFLVAKFRMGYVWRISVALVVLLLFAFETNKRAYEWSNTKSLTGSIIEKSPGVIMAYNLRGIWYYNNGDIQASIHDFNNAISILSTYSSAWYNRGLSYAALHDFAEAKKDYTRAIELNPRFVSAYIARGILRLDIYSDFSGAVIDFSKAIKLKPENAQAWYNRGLAYFRMHETAKACSDWVMVQRLGYTQADIMISRYCP